jgi:hypothetical protein
MVGAPSAPVHFGLVRLHNLNDVLGRWTSSTVDVLGHLTDFVVPNLYYTKQLVRYAASAHSNDAVWSTWGGYKEGERNRAQPTVLASALHLPISPCCLCCASVPKSSFGLQSSVVFESHLHAAEDAADVVEPASQAARRTASKVVSIAERHAPAPRTLEATLQPMAPLLLHGCRSAHHVSGLAACIASPCPSGVPVQRTVTSRGSTGAIQAVPTVRSAIPNPPKRPIPASAPSPQHLTDRSTAPF